MPRFLKTALLIILISTLSSSLLRAQEVDHIYLKSGSVIRGDLLEVEPADHIKVQDLCGNIWYYHMDQVEKITSEPYERPGSNTKLPGFEHGFVNITSMGFLAGSSSNMQVAPFSLLMVNGWRNALGLFTGVGVGIEFLSSSYFPVFLDLRYDLMGKDVVPYLVAKGGYSFPMSSGYSEYDTKYSYSGGPLVAAGMGLKIRTRSHFAWDVELMYRFQRTSYMESYGWNNQEYSYTNIYNRIEIRLGFYID